MFQKASSRQSLRRLENACPIERKYTSRITNKRSQKHGENSS